MVALAGMDVESVCLCGVIHTVYTVNVSRYISITVYKLVMRLSDMVDL